MRRWQLGHVTRQRARGLRSSLQVLAGLTRRRRVSRAPFLICDLDDVVSVVLLARRLMDSLVLHIASRPADLFDREPRTFNRTSQVR